MCKTMKNFFASLVWMFLSLTALNVAIAQDDDDTEDDLDFSYTSANVNQLARDEISLRLEPLGLGLMGDSIDKYTGTLVFNQTDVSIPGNSDLEVAIRRIATSSELTNQKEGFFGDWILDAPNISALSSSTNDPQEYFGCIKSMYKDLEASVSGANGNYYIPASAYWDGLKLNIPGQGGKMLLENYSPTIASFDYFDQELWKPFDTAYSGSGGYSENNIGRITKDHWVVTCINPRSGGGGLIVDDDGGSSDGYMAISPDGKRYRMDKLVYMESNNYKADVGDDQVNFSRNIGRFYATEVTDIHGNWVKYNWSTDGKLLSISSNDGREITLAYHPDSSRIASVTANGRTWTYTYRTVENPSAYSSISEEIPNALYRVAQPDGKYWEYNLDFLTLSAPSTGFASDSVPTPYGYLNTYVKHPYGTRADYEIGKITHMRKGYGAHDPYSYRNTHSVLSKTLSGPSIPVSVWEYEYEQYDEDEPYSVKDTKTTTVTRPDGSTQVSHYFRDSEQHWFISALFGKVSKEEVFANTGGLLEQTDYTYEIGGRMGGSGIMENQNLNPQISRYVYTKSKVVTRHGDTYTTEYDYITDQNSTNYSYHKPISIKTYSNISTTPRETVKTYDHRKDHWILSLPETVTINNRLTSEYGYTDLGQKEWENRYGHRIADYTYHNASGLLYSMTDANDNASYWLNYYRGTAKNIRRPDGKQDTYAVDANGWVTKVTDYGGFTTIYQHDSMGRFTKVIPNKDKRSWVDTDITYAFGDEVIQTIARGNQQEIVTYDNLFRAITEQKYDVLTGNSIYREMTYDASDRKVFESFPSSAADPTDGTEFTYDALGRQRQARENVSPFATVSTNYLNDHVKQVVDAKDYSTEYYYSGYHSSGTKELLTIKQPLGVTTDITRNIWGERTELTQSGTYNGGPIGETQKYYYNSRYRLCGHYTAEGGLTRYGYDAAGRMTSYQKGAADSATCVAPSGTDLVSLTYDDLDRVTLTNFADTATSDISKSYDDNGNVLTVNRAGINWSYSYDELNQLTSEQLDIDSRSYDLTYSYDNSSNMIKRTLPSGRLVEYEHDGFGRVTNVESGGTDYASAMTYHANGMVEGMTYGNGQQFSQTLNSRLKPASLLSQSGATTAIDLSYSYDARGDITSIIDGTDSANNKALEYDDLGRLTSASGSWGAGAFTYDALGNLRQKQLGSRVVTVSYDANNRASQSTDTAASTRAIAYDNRGNVTTLGALSFTYDKAQQPIVLSGSSSGLYEYDGNLKRVKAEVDGNTIYNVYDAAGNLVYVDQITAGSVIEVCLTSCSDIDIPKATDYIKAGGMTIARISSGNLTYLHPDHLGSPVVGTNALGSIDWKENFTPFGEKLIGDTANDDLGSYTGHISDSATGLTYMQARYYDPVIGRFLSIDPVGFSPDKPYMFNRYSYVGNDPVNRTDPFGLTDDESIGDQVGGGDDDCGKYTWSTCYEFDEFGEVSDNENITLGNTTNIASTALGGAAIGNTYSMCQSGVCFDKWLGKNGNWYNTTWGGGNGAGRRSLAMYNTASFSAVGKGITALSFAVEGADMAAAIGNNDVLAIADSGLDFAVIGLSLTGGPFAWAGGTAYGLIDNTVGWSWLEYGRENAVEQSYGGIW